MNCRAHAAQLRRRYDEISARGADVVAIGTGDIRYAKAFVADEQVPFRVFVDDQALAAQAASVKRASPWGLFSPKSWAATRQAWRDGYHLFKSGKRVTQLGATFVLGPGSVVRYAHVDAHTGDHAPLEDVLAALP
ncbi:MAG TPA: peroxiredoxin-like family protein [Acidimicrobiales bacterium]|nr:peroxiredoxin-like family protein [Acidimicrobiales bacterium]